MNIVELPYVTISKVDKNTIKAIYKDKCILDRDKLEEVRSIYSKMHTSENLMGLKLIVIFQGETKFDLEDGLKYMTTRLRDKIGEAFVAKSPFTLMYLKSVIHIVKAQYPIQIFKTEKEGMNWLSSLD